MNSCPSKMSEAVADNMIEPDDVAAQGEAATAATVATSEPSRP